MALSFSNVQGQSNQQRPQQNNQPISNSNINLEGNLIQNIGENIQSIGAGITTLAGAILGYDKEARQQLINTFNKIKDDPREVKMLGDAILSTYNLTVDDLFSMPLGEMVGNVLSGAWKHPVDAFLDVSTLGAMTGVKIPSKIKKLLPAIDEADTRIRLAEEVTKDNLRVNNIGKDFVKQIENIEAKFSPQDISKAMQAIETVGFKNAPDYLRPAMVELNKANDTYKQLTEMVGAKIYDDADFAAKELLAKRTKIPFQEFDTPEFMKTKTYQDALDYVKENDIRPLFHLKPKVYTNNDLIAGEKVETDLLKRGYGTIDYSDAPINITNKAAEFVDKVITTKALDSADSLNDKIKAYNEVNETKIKPVSTSASVFNNRLLNEANRELKKTMLGSGTYLGANIITTTLSILNNFDLRAATRTIENLPKFRLIELSEAKTPLLNLISRVNNKVYRPIASVDRWLEDVAKEYIKNYGADKAKYLQSAIPSLVTPTNQVEAAIKSLIPFGSYPIAAMREVGANIAGRPLKTNLYNQLQKEGQQLNIQTQEANPQIQEVVPTEAIRTGEDGELVRRSTVITPIQAANMFVFGQYGDAIQIPLVTFLNKLLKGEGDPDVIEINGKSYRVNQGTITTNKGSLNILPALAYIGRNILTPVQFYNQVIVPLMSDKYYKDETKLFNEIVSEAQYSNMNAMAQRRIVDNAKDKLGKKILGTYEYDYWKDTVSRTNRRKIIREQMIRKNIDTALED